MQEQLPHIANVVLDWIEANNKEEAVVDFQNTMYYFGFRAAVRVSVNYDVSSPEEAEGKLGNLHVSFSVNDDCFEEFRRCYDTVISMTFDTQTRQLSSEEKQRLKKDSAYIHSKIEEFRSRVVNEHPDSFNSILRKQENPLTNSAFTEQESRSLMAALIVGSYHTTSVSAMWVFYELAKNPIVQQKLYEEVKAVVEKAGGILKLSQDQSWSHCSYLKAVIEETFRVDPPGSFASRLGVFFFSLFIFNCNFFLDTFQRELRLEIFLFLQAQTSSFLWHCSAEIVECSIVPMFLSQSDSSEIPNFTSLCKRSDSE